MKPAVPNVPGSALLVVRLVSWTLHPCGVKRPCNMGSLDPRDCFPNGKSTRNWEIHGGYLGILTKNVIFNSYAGYQSVYSNDFVWGGFLFWQVKGKKEGVDTSEHYRSTCPGPNWKGTLFGTFQHEEVYGTGPIDWILGCLILIYGCCFLDLWMRKDLELGKSQTASGFRMHRRFHVSPLQPWITDFSLNWPVSGHEMAMDLWINTCWQCFWPCQTGNIQGWDP